MNKTEAGRRLAHANALYDDLSIDTTEYQAFLRELTPWLRSLPAAEKRWFIDGLVSHTLEHSE